MVKGGGNGNGNQNSDVPSRRAGRRASCPSACSSSHRLRSRRRIGDRGRRGACCLYVVSGCSKSWVGNGILIGLILGSEFGLVRVWKTRSGVCYIDSRFILVRTGVTSAHGRHPSGVRRLEGRSDVVAAAEKLVHTAVLKMTDLVELLGGEEQGDNNQSQQSAAKRRRPITTLQTSTVSHSN